MSGSIDQNQPPSPNKNDPVVVKDTGSLFENVNAAHTAADSATVKDGELRQSFGNMVTQPGQKVGTDFTVAEDLHRR